MRGTCTWPGAAGTWPGWPPPPPGGEEIGRGAYELVALDGLAFVDSGWYAEEEKPFGGGRVCREEEPSRVGRWLSKTVKKKKRKKAADRKEKGATNKVSLSYFCSSSVRFVRSFDLARMKAAATPVIANRRALKDILRCFIMRIRVIYSGRFSEPIIYFHCQHRGTARRCD